MSTPDRIARIASIHPTVYFIRTEQRLKQRIDIDVETVSECEPAILRVSGPGLDAQIRLDSLPIGSSSHSIYLPEIEVMASMDFALVCGTTVMDVQTLQMQPERHWTIYLTPGSHHDLGYTDLPSNVLREHDRYLDEVIRICEQTSELPKDARFHYTVEQAWSILHWMENRPAEQVDQLARLLRKRRVEVTALFGNQTTELCSHEELIRLLYPAARIQRRFGISLKVAELNDIPGITWGLASVLAGAGIRYFAPGIPDYFNWGRKTRFLWDEQAVLQRDLPGAFWWEGPDSQRVLFWYRGGAMHWEDVWTCDQIERDLPVKLAGMVESGYPYDFVHFGVNGGKRDNAPPDMRFSLIASEWNTHWAFPRLVVSTHSAFFHRLENEAGHGLKVLRGDLPGTDYPTGAASTARETAVNRAAHDWLDAAERMAVWAAVTGYSYPADTLLEAMDQMLLFDEHTWGMAHPVGPAQDACWSQKSQFAYRAAALAQDVQIKSTNRVADQIHLEDTGFHLVVFNPLHMDCTGLAAVQALPSAPCSRPMYWELRNEGDPAMHVGGSGPGRGLSSLPGDLLESPFDLVDLSTGECVPYQVITLEDPLAARPQAAQRYALGHTDSASLDVLNYNSSQVQDVYFIARDVPAMGYKTYRVVPKEVKTKVPINGVQVGEDWLENAYYRVRLDGKTGRITSILDKDLNRELVDASAAYGFNQLVTRDPRTGRCEIPESATVTRGEQGPLVGSLVVRGASRGIPQWTQEITLYAEIQRVDFASRMLKDATPMIEHHFAFPFDLKQPHFRFEGPGAVIEPVRDQIPGSNTSAYAVQHWVKVYNPETTVIWSSLDAPVAAFGQLWPSPVSQAHHGATPPGYGQDFLTFPDEFNCGHIFSLAAVNNFRTNFQPSQAADLLFRYSITSSAASQDDQTARAFGLAMASPLTGAIVRGPTSGNLPVSTGFCKIEPPEVALLALKAAEDGDGIILRLYETTGQETNARVELPYLKIQQAFRTDLMERNLATLTWERHAVQVTLPAGGVVTVRCRTPEIHWPVSQHYWYD